MAMVFKYCDPRILAVELAMFKFTLYHVCSVKWLHIGNLFLGIPL